MTMLVLQEVTFLSHYIASYDSVNAPTTVFLLAYKIITAMLSILNNLAIVLETLISAGPRFSHTPVCFVSVIGVAKHIFLEYTASYFLFLLSKI